METILGIVCLSFTVFFFVLSPTMLFCIYVMLNTHWVIVGKVFEMYLPLSLWIFYKKKGKLRFAFWNFSFSGDNIMSMLIQHVMNTCGFSLNFLFLDHLEAESNRDSPQPTDDSTRDQSSSHTDGVLESASQTHIGDIDGLSVEEVAKRIVADTLSRAIQNHCVNLETNSVCDSWSTVF